MLELSEAREKAKQILDEERSSPSVSYLRKRGDETSVAATQELQAGNPRRESVIWERPREFTFESVNHELLCALLLQVAEQERDSFVHSVALRIVTPPACGKSTGHFQFPSELPLVAEFLVRNGGKQTLFPIISEASPLPGHLSLFRHLQDMVSLDFRLFSESEYEKFAFSIANYGRTVKSKYDGSEGSRNSPNALAQFPEIGTIHISNYCLELAEAAERIVELCRKARYLYLKGALLEGLNLEVNQDRSVVGSYLKELGFSVTLIQCLDEAEKLYQGPTSSFDLKSSMTHLRSFIENLHDEAGPALEAKFGKVFSAGWGPSLVYLRQNGVLSAAEEKLAAGLYTFISDEAVHPLVAEREYARLARNMVIEYGLLLLRKLEKIAVHIQKPRVIPDFK